LDKIKAVEVMKTWHGEIFSGQRVLLIRFKSCNLNCSFCDTKNKINNFMEGDYDLEEIQNRFRQQPNLGLLLTGGEPTFQSNLNYSTLLLNLIDCSFKVVETNGYGLIPLYENVNDPDVKYVYSPKFYVMNNMWEKMDKLLSFLEKIGDNLYIKLVYDNEHTKDYLDHIHMYFSKRKIQYPKNIYIMPEGKTREEVIQSAKKAFRLAGEYNVNITTRLHLIHNFY